MDLYSYQNIKAEKEKAIMKYRRMQKMTILFRFVEFCIFAIAFSRFSVHFPQVLNFSGDHFKEILVSLVSPRFLFVVGNAIVVILYLKSKKSSTDDNSEEMNNKQSISISGEEEDAVPEKRRKIEQAPVSSLEKNCPAPEDGKLDLYDDDDKRFPGNSFFHESNEPMNKQRSEEETPARCRQMHRSQSESWIVTTVPERTKDLRRWATVECRKSEERAVETEEMSSEEFRRKVEDFIARQQRLLREEEFLASEE
ncbi:unnamed protein product [Cuscuta europaea]|uniref:DUF4408 domain-containing protein n=1 Tax=Cuscuta europaea TaxID=41803 RepID=A0A9P0YHZ9_CUSEU|nr:unnamed protein product [Cuscuta europaea]